jgi:hypothetical protein
MRSGTFGLKLTFLLSIPERLLRAATGIVGGAALSLVDVLLPDALRKTTIYRILFGDTLRFAVERVAGVPPLSTGEETPLPQDFQARKLAGTAIESLGLLAVQFSPLWVFAIAGDAAAGSKLFLHRLEGYLKQEGVIDPTVEVGGLADLLDALQQASRATAITIDTPPLSRQELERMSSELKAAYREVFKGSMNLVPRIEQLWSRMQLASAESGISLQQIAGYMARSSQTWITKGRRTLKALGRTGTDLAGEQILSGYQRTLDELTSGGPRAFVQVRFSPYLQAARRQFNPETQSWTEMLIGRQTSKAGADQAGSI